MRVALVLFSGGMDSVICLGWARQQFDAVYALTIDYGQRHAVEVEAAKKVMELLGLTKAHEVVSLGPVLKGTSPLTDPEQQVQRYDSIQAMGGDQDTPTEPTFVPARNLLFLSIALNRAAVLNARHIVMGVCQADYGGYPDCRQDFIDSAGRAMSQAVFGVNHALSLHTPLMNLSKAEAIQMAADMPGVMEAMAYTHTSYEGDYPPNPFNHASLLRARGFHEANVPDPLIQRAINEQKLPADYPADGYVEGTAYGDQKQWNALTGIPDTTLEKKAAEGEAVLDPNSGEVATSSGVESTAKESKRKPKANEGAPKIVEGDAQQA